MKKIVIAINIILLMILNTACEEAQNEVKTVHIAQSKVDKQGRVSNCWAYTLTAFLESRHLERTDGQEELNLSEEYLLFQYMLKTLQVFAMNPNEKIAMKVKVKEGVRILNGLQLINEVGVVPESSFGYKFRSAYTDDETGEEIQYMGDRVTEYFRKEFSDSAKLDRYKKEPGLLEDELWKVWTDHLFKVCQ